MDNESIYLLSREHFMYEFNDKKILCNQHEFEYWCGKHRPKMQKYVAMMEFGKMKLMQFEKMKLNVKYGRGVKHGNISRNKEN